MKKKWIWLWSTLLLIGCNNNTESTLSIPDELQGQSFIFTMKKCDYKQIACQTSISTTAVAVGKMEVFFHKDNITLEPSQAVINEPLLGKTIGSMTNFHEMINASVEVNLLDKTDVFIDDYEGKKILNYAYSIIFDLEHNEGGETYKNNVRFVFYVNPNNSSENAMSMEISLDITTRNDIKLKSLKDNFPRSYIEPVDFLGILFEVT